MWIRASEAGKGIGSAALEALLEHERERVRGGAALLSWSGSMFEYLMPRLVMTAEQRLLPVLQRRGQLDRQSDSPHWPRQ